MFACDNLLGNEMTFSIVLGVCIWCFTKKITNSIQFNVFVHFYLLYDFKVLSNSIYTLLYKTKCVYMIDMCQIEVKFNHLLMNSQNNIVKIESGPQRNDAWIDNIFSFSLFVGDLQDFDLDALLWGWHGSNLSTSYWVITDIRWQYDVNMMKW